MVIAEPGMMRLSRETAARRQEQSDNPASQAPCGPLHAVEQQLWEARVAEGPRVVPQRVLVHPALAVQLGTYHRVELGPRQDAPLHLVAVEGIELVLDVEILQPLGDRRADDSGAIPLSSGSPRGAPLRWRNYHEAFWPSSPSR